MRLQSWLIALAILFVMAGGKEKGGEAAIHEYKGTAFLPFAKGGEGEGGALIFEGGREGLFEGKEGGKVDTSGVIVRRASDGRSYIRISDVTVTRQEHVARKFDAKSHNSGIVHIVAFSLDHRNLVGYTFPDGSIQYCCTDELVPKTHCAPGQIIIMPHSGTTGWPSVTNAFFRGNNTQLHMDVETLHVPQTGMYYLWFVSCNVEQSPLALRGLTTWKNPHGYLPGMRAPYLFFFGLMSLLYLCLGLLWLVQYARFWREVLSLQNCISAVMAVGMMEMSTWYWDYLNFNHTGLRPYAITLLAVILGTLRKTAARVLLLTVSMGYGVVRPTLGGLTKQVVVLACLYFGSCSLLDIVTSVGVVDDLAPNFRTLLIVPVAVLDSIIIVWIFTALSGTLSKLHARKQTAKFEMYRKFSTLLIMSVVISVLWIGYEMYITVADNLNSRQWRIDWVTGAFWHVLNFVMLAVVCFLWRPIENATRYAYSEELGEYDEDIFLEEQLPKSSGPTTTLRRETIQLPMLEVERDEKLA